MKKEGNLILNLPALDLVYLEYKPKNTSLGASSLGLDLNERPGDRIPLFAGRM
jgi:hypothetical protein